MERMGPFLVATVALLVVPGPSVVFAVTRALSLGRAAGLVSVVGLEAGLLVHVTAATVGLSALAASSKVTTTGLRLAGAAYLIFLAARIALEHPSPVSRGGRPVQSDGAVVASSAGRPRPARWALARDAFLVDLLNPQSLLFFMAFLPQFVDVRHGAANRRAVRPRGVRPGPRGARATARQCNSRAGGLVGRALGRAARVERPRRGAAGCTSSARRGPGGVWGRFPAPRPVRGAGPPVTAPERLDLGPGRRQDASTGAGRRAAPCRRAGPRAGRVQASVMDRRLPCPVFVQPAPRRRPWTGPATCGGGPGEPSQTEDADRAARMRAAALPPATPRFARSRGEHIGSCPSLRGAATQGLPGRGRPAARRLPRGRRARSRAGGRAGAARWARRGPAGP